MKALVAADRPPVRDAVAHALGAHFAEVQVRMADSAPECRHLLQRWTPDLAVIDIDVPPAGLLSVCRALHAAEARTLVVVSGGSDEVLDLLGAGVHGVFASGEGLDSLIGAVRTILDGHTHVPSSLLGGVLHGLISRNDRQERTRDRFQRLSRREREVLSLLGSGRDHLSIARSLAISPHTAKTHIRHVMAKLEVSSRIEAAAVAAELGLGSEPQGVRV